MIALRFMGRAARGAAPPSSPPAQPATAPRPLLDAADASGDGAQAPAAPRASSTRAMAAGAQVRVLCAVPGHRRWSLVGSMTAAPALAALALGLAE